MPERSGRPDGLLHDQRRARRPQTTKRLHRSRDRMIGGVAAGVSEFIGVDVAITRWIFAATVPLSIGTSVAAYLLLWVLLPAPESGQTGAG